jgi:hypothetical protein
VSKLTKSWLVAELEAILAKSGDSITPAWHDKPERSQLAFA